MDRNKLNAYVAKLESRWRPFLEKLADAEHPHDSSRPGWGPQDEAWIQMVNHLDGIAAAYVAWQAEGKTINECGPIDDARLLELIEPCIRHEADRRVFLATCKHHVAEWQELNKSAVSDPEESDPEEN
jgi:hypothetical protein